MNTFLITLLVGNSVLLLFLGLRLYKNANTVESPENIVNRIDSLESAVSMAREAAKKTESRIADIILQKGDETQAELQRPVAELVQTSVQVQKKLVEIIGELNSGQSNIDAQISALRQHSAEQQALLNKFQQGYNFTVNKTLLVAMIRMIERLEEQIESISDEHALATLSELRDHLLIAMESQDVEQKMPPVNADYKEHMKYATAKPTPSQSSNEVGKIASVLRPAYIYFGGQEKRVIRPGEVLVYQLENKENIGDDNE